MAINKKGSVIDLFVIAVIVLAFGIALLLAFRIASDFDTKVNELSIITPEASAVSTKMVGHFSGILDNSFLFVTIGLALATLILASLVRIHPIFIPFFIIALIFVVFFSGVASNIYQEMAANPELSTYADQLTFTGTIMTFLPLIIGIIGTILMVVQYKLWQNSEVY